MQEVAISEFKAKCLALLEQVRATKKLVARGLQMHQHPADRILAATAEVLDLTLVTADERLLGLGTIRTMANR